jgi:hypothetical protein
VLTRSRSERRESHSRPSAEIRTRLASSHTSTAITFSETINQLATDHVRLSADLEAANSRCESLESDLARIQVKLEIMTRRKEEGMALVLRYKDITMKTLRESYRALEDVFPSDMLDGLRAGVPLIKSGYECDTICGP